MNSIKQKICKHIVDKLGVNENIVQDGTSFTYDFGADSLSVFELLTSIEKEFGITIPDGEAEKIKTVAALNTYLLKHISVTAEQ